MDLILLAVPIFFLLIGIELIAEKVRGTNYYRLNDSITSLTAGTLSQLLKVVQLMVPFTIYVMAFQQFSLFNLGDSALVWIIAFVLYDFSYYWLHRCGHEVNILWAAHVVHHSSEEYNLTTALRQTGTSTLSFLFYLPLAILGFEPLMLATVGALNLIYQYWVHTQHIGKLGWYEKYFVTPSNHRGHHAQNAVYIDRNYGGVFIIWDRLFGSYQEELEDDLPIYGIRGALNSWNPLWANVQVYKQLMDDCRHSTNWRHKLTIWFRRTGWRPPDVVQQYPLNKTDLSKFTKFDTALSAATKVYAVIAYVFNAGVALSLVMNLQLLSPIQQLLIIGFVLISTFLVGAMLERRAFAPKLELIKYTVFILLTVILLPINALSISGILIALAGIFAISLSELRSTKAA
ncbi:MAG: alkylglycerol monooxygenase [Arenicella sp.]|jgi:alkylglycerol monooxygenase